MKNNFIKLFLFLAIVSCNNSKDNLAIIKFEKIINLGIVGKNDTITKKLLIKNISSTTLKIKQIKSSCGCTVVKSNDSLVEGGKSTYISIKYISDNLEGTIIKSIVIDANTKPNFNVVYLKGRIQ